MSIITVTEFLRDRGISEDILSRLEEEKIDRDVILLMDDSVLANYIPSYGDRLALFHFCRSQKPASKRKLGLFERLREKMKLRKQSTTEPQSKETPETSNPKSRSKASKRQIEIGWIHADNKETKQVRTKQGGGTRKLAMDINAGYNEILKEEVQDVQLDGSQQPLSGHQEVRSSSSAALHQRGII
ncbi:hypothetical protein QQF64_036021 [Cirrhinus molitorella]|uniref:Uncharacterized protein n=1 Tax=Cirrhinus molitorella TaxID=172907 RepID=A0ABR3NI80_9TELE